MMGCCVGCISGDPDGDVKWFNACSADSLALQTANVGYGFKNAVSYRTAAQRSRLANRSGNINGELAGRIVFYKRAQKNTNYSYIAEIPELNIKAGDHFYAKAYINVPFGRIPIGLNNIPENKYLIGRASTLLSAVPRAVAVHIFVDDIQQPHEHFCSIPDKKCYNKKMTEEFKSLNPKSSPITEAFPGSFLTYLVSREQDPYFFLHFPLIGSRRDYKLATGDYGKNFILCFSDLLKSIPIGKHLLEFKVYLWFDHIFYNYYPLGKGTNPLGRWNSNLHNSMLKSPHPNPRRLQRSEIIAQGKVNINLQENFAHNESYYVDYYLSDEDLENLKKIGKKLR